MAEPRLRRRDLSPAAVAVRCLARGVGARVAAAAAGVLHGRLRQSSWRTEIEALAAMHRFHRQATRAARAVVPELCIDRRGVPWVSGTPRRAWFALGVASAWSHGFAMDAARRRAAGTLSELLGEPALDGDMLARRIGFAFYADRIAAALPADQRAVLDAYADGVNALFARAKPWEYTVLGLEPPTWSAAHSVLVAQDMFHQLTDPSGHELRARLDELTDGGAALIDRTLGATTAVHGGPAGDPEGSALLRRVLAAAHTAAADDVPARQEPAVGSNGWASGSVLANDIHLALGVPNPLMAAGATVDGALTRGFLRPGLPVFLAGATASLAWGVTRLCGRTSGRLPAGVRGTAPVVDRTEVLAAGGRSVRVRVRLADAGPVLSDGSVLRWLALEPGAVEFGLSGLARCETVAQACDVAVRSGAPPVSVLVTDRHGDAAWTAAGRMIRSGIGELVPPADVPRVAAGPDGVLVAANCDPAVALADGASVAENAYPHDRARRIAALVGAGLPTAAVQSDVDSSFYLPWREVFLPYLAKTPAVAAAVSAWDGTADVHASGLHYLVLMHRLVRARVTAALAPRIPADDLFGPGSLAALDAELAGIVAEGDPELTPPGFRDWPHLLRWAALAATRYLEQKLGPDAPAMPWGAVNRLGLRHPLSARLPRLRWAIDQPDLPRRGCQQSVDAAAAGFGAAMRMVGDPVTGSFRVSWPGGQSGDPLARGHRSLLPAWLAGRLVELTPPRGSARR